MEDRAYWLGDMTPRETGRLLEAIERATLTSKASAAAMKTIMSRQQAGARRLPHFLDVPVAHKTGDSGVIANDVGLVSARSGTVIISFFVNGITGPYAETEDRIGRVSRQIVDYFDGTPARKPRSPTRLPRPASALTSASRRRSVVPRRSRPAGSAGEPGEVCPGGRRSWGRSNGGGGEVRAGATRW